MHSILERLLISQTSPGSASSDRAFRRPWRFGASGSVDLPAQNTKYGRYRPDSEVIDIGTSASGSPTTHRDGQPQTGQSGYPTIAPLFVTIEKAWFSLVIELVLRDDECPGVVERQLQ